MGTRSYSPNVGHALQYAAEVHADQQRKGKDEPYLSHVLRVAGLVAHYGGDEVQIIAAALHDAAEDRGGQGTLGEIRARFGLEVADIVRQCSDSLVSPRSDKPDWRSRKEAYLNRVRDRGPAAASLVEACDKVANLEDIIEDLARDGEGFLDRFAGGADGVRWYYLELGRWLLPQVPVLQARFDALLAQLLGGPDDRAATQF
jgi:(p)ppGpp synthase/HD superfamily hydrolase